MHGCIASVRECDLQHAGTETVQGFSNVRLSAFRRDRYTTLPETGDRILATTVEATWEYAQPAIDHAAAWADVRRAVESAFTSHFSRSVQETIWILGNAALEANEAIDWIHLRLPNLHHLPVDLSPFGLDGRGEVFVATSAPYGLIEGTIRRSAATVAI